MTEPDIDHLRAWIGREELARETLTPALVARFAATFDLETDASPGGIAPLLIHFCLAQPAVATSELGPDGHPARGRFLPPVPLPRRMWAGGEIKFLGDIRIGDEVTRRSTVTDVALKQGRSGALCFVTVEHEIASGGRIAVTERQDLVYREPEMSGAPPKQAQAAPAGEEVRRIEASPTLLFRYSALTFNGHRIHYDAPYARQVEGYPGLIVHGPMQATLLVEFATRLRGARPVAFRFRSLSPIFDNASFTLNATQQADSIKLWTSSEGGPMAMEAKATW